MMDSPDNSLGTGHPDEQAATGEIMHRLMTELYPICRSITGDGVRQTLSILSRYIPLKVQEVPSGTPVFDWTVPKEWNIRDAYVKDSQGRRVVDFQKSNLHVVSYSRPVRQKMPLAELRKHLFSLPEHPDWIPYRTTYYNENWGFCVSHHQLEAMRDEEYEVCIDSSLSDGNLTYGEYFIPGDTDEEVLISCHICHPSLCNDNLSGIALATFLALNLSDKPHRYSYRFLFIPGTIGSITWLSRNDENVVKIKHGLVVVCVGDSGKYTYKKSRRGNTEIDRVVMHVLKNTNKEFNIDDFSPYGYDERQYCSPGFDLAVGSLSRSSHGQYPQYHTSADNLELVRPEYLAESLSLYLSVFDVLEHNYRYVNLNPKCEPQLGKRGLYSGIGTQDKDHIDVMALLWVLNLSDGDYSLLDIAERSAIPFEKIRRAADALSHANLLKQYRGMVSEPASRTRE